MARKKRSSIRILDGYQVVKMGEMEIWDGADLAATWQAGELVGWCLLALFVRPIGARIVARLAGFFNLLNAPIFAAWVYHLSGRRAVTWQPSQC